MKTFLFCLCAIVVHAGWVTDRPTAGAFPLVARGHAAVWRVDPADFPVVHRAVADVHTDVARVTGVTPATDPADSELEVWVGTLGHSARIDQLVADSRIDVTDLTGAWESFVITIVTAPTPGVDRALVIVGSDRRGTAYGAYELAEAIGVSPWHWWSDVAPARRAALYVAADTRRFGPPSVKYRGIFLNDEDWGLQPWAAETFDPAYGDIGPRTYAKVFELLLRLKANTLWPAMHACTRAFNLDPANAALADEYAIIMGSSHAEPLLRNNVGEWTAPKSDYNYVTHREAVRSYWEERVQSNGGFENLYTLGMRGIHDSGIQGTTSDAQRIGVLEQVFADQRDLLSRHATTPAHAMPAQIFCAYKEVLDLYRQGLDVPDDVTIIWPDDNFGYVRNFAASAEQTRHGGFGVYYHISYLGHPLAYLWLNTTPPALIWEEMVKSHAYGTDDVWIVNVGDLKPAEIGTEFFLRLAWDIDAYGPDAQPQFLRDWSARTFGSAQAEAIAKTMGEFYRLNSVRKPEHLQWWKPLKEAPKASPLTSAQIDARLADFVRIRAEADRIAQALPDEKQAAFFQLVFYPVHGATLANQRYFAGERGETVTAQAAHANLQKLTAGFGELLDGKWRGFMQLEPADNDWRSMRIGRWEMPDFPDKPPLETASAIVLELSPPLPTGLDHDVPAWHTVSGLGHSGHAVTVLPFDTVHHPEITVTFTLPAPGEFTLELHRLPTHPIDPVVGQSVSFELDGQYVGTLDATTPDGSEAWQHGVLNNRVTHTLDLGQLAAGEHRLTLSAGPGLVIDSWQLVPTPPSP